RETPDINFRYSSPPHRPPRHHSVHPRLPSSSLNHDGTPAPVESLPPPRPVPFDGGVSETPITPTTVWPRPSIPPKTFFLAKDRNPPPIPAKSFQRAPTLPKPRGVNNQATPPPALPPRRLPVLQPPRTQTPVTLPASTLASSVQRISSTPELLDDLGSDGSSASMKTMESAECSVEGFTLLGLHPPLGVSHSDESTVTHRDEIERHATEKEGRLTAQANQIASRLGGRSVGRGVLMVVFAATRRQNSRVSHANA
uniref:WH2 domain-containing protein n=1 Tax=Mesocestoides corti TaxID=53468 RepID=A0A5K3FIC6_MESCO